MLCSCGNPKADTRPKPEPQATATAAVANHEFSGDSAYAYVKAQVDMGPRVPGTKAHAACTEYLATKLRSFGADTVEVQRGSAKAFDGITLPIANVIARYNGTNPNARRVLLVAHYDTRPWADNDPDPANRQAPIDGANDGASGVGVLLEVARQLGERRPEVSVDLLLCDVEDYGTGGVDDSWCLGSQYYVSHNPFAAGRPAFGILLDMVGGKDATFYREQFSEVYAPNVNAMVWERAKSLGLESRFVDKVGGAITDDHVYLNMAGVPTIDIIEMNHPDTGSFPPQWHTLADNMANIDPATLAAVGQVVTSVLYDTPRTN